MPLDIIRRAAGKEDRRAADIGRVAPTLLGDALEDLAIARFVRLERSGVVGKVIYVPSGNNLVNHNIGVTL